MRLIGYRSADEEDLADRIGAALCAPRPAFTRALAIVGDRNLRRLSRVFVFSRGAAALRVAECTGSPVALLGPDKIRVRGRPWSWPSNDQGFRILSAGGPGVRAARVERGRVVLRPAV